MKKFLILLFIFGVACSTFAFGQGTMVFDRLADLIDDSTHRLVTDAEKSTWNAKGDVTGVGDCTSGDCLDGTSDGGTWIKFYDAQGAGQLITGNLTAARVWTLPDATGTLIYSDGAFHDGFSDFVANEHIDWTSDQGATNIHSGNIPDLSGTYQTVLTNSAGLLGALNDETGTGLAVFNTAPTFATSITGSYLTASEILITDGDKKIISAPVATYPSLAELARLKGMTSKVIDDDQIDTFAELDTIVADKALVNKADGAIWAGTHDFQGATFKANNIQSDTQIEFTPTILTMTQSSTGSTLTGDWNSATAGADNNTTLIATTAFVQQEINGAGGRSLTCGSGSCDADSELYTGTIGAYLEHLYAAETFTNVLMTSVAGTITRVKCYTVAGTSSINVVNGGNNVLSSALACDTDGQSSCASGCDVNTINTDYDNLTAFTPANVDTSLATIGNTTTVWVTFTKDD